MRDVTDGRQTERESPRAYPPHLRLVWSNPLAPARGRLRVNLALAIERHLSGADGLTHEQFLALFSGRGTRRLSAVPAPWPS